MNSAAGALPLIFETSIAAQMILFAGVQAAGIRRFGMLRAIVAVATGSMGLAAAINLFTAVGAWGGLRDLNLILELLCVVASYLYVARAYEDAPKSDLNDIWHLAAPASVFMAWKTGLVTGVDTLMLAMLSAYLIASVVVLSANWIRYRAKAVAWFAVALVVSVGVLIALRVAMMYEAGLGLGMRESSAYLMLLVFMLVVSSAVLLVELRHPNLLSAPGPLIKQPPPGALGERELGVIDERFRRFMAAERPFLDSELSLSDLAARLQVKSRDLSQLANMRYRMTVPALLNVWRLEEAARLLSDRGNTSPVTTIMYDAGFGSKSSFQREFQKKFGVSPSAYRASANSGDAVHDSLPSETWRENT